MAVVVVVVRPKVRLAKVIRSHMSQPLGVSQDVTTRDWTVVRRVIQVNQLSSRKWSEDGASRFEHEVVSSSNMRGQATFPDQLSLFKRSRSRQLKASVVFR